MKIVSIFVFAAVAGVTLFFAYGYRYDVEERVVQKTSIIDITPRVREIEVYLDGRKVVGELPFQIKGVLPGIHQLELKKEGFVNWKREVEVKEDIVSIVYDALPVPESLADFTFEKAVFGEDEKVFYGKGYVLSYLPGEPSINITSLFKNGNVTTEEISLYREDFNVVELFPEEKFLLVFDDEYGVRKDDLFAYVSFSDREFELFALPRGADAVKVDGNTVFFMSGGNLFSAGFDILDSGEYVDSEDFLFAEGVSRYDTDYRGHVFYISEGMLYRKGYGDEPPVLLSACAGCYENLAVHVKSGNRLMVLRDTGGFRKLFLLDNGSLKLLTSDLRGYPDVNGRNQVIYGDGRGYAVVYDIVEKTKEAAKLAEPDTEIIGWFGDEGHYLAVRGGNLYMNDIFGVEPVMLAENFDTVSAIIEGRTIYMLKEGRLSAVYFDGAYAE